MSMARQTIKRFTAGIIAFVLLCSLNITAFAQGKSADVIGEYYEFDGKADYSLEEGTASKTVKPMGHFSISGNFKDTGNGVYYIQSGTVDVAYSVNRSALETDSERWHLTADKGNKVNGIKLDNDILSGAIIVQSSIDGENWLTDKVHTDAFQAKTELPQTIFTTKRIHQLNGCHYRIIVAYKLEKKVDQSKILFWDKDNFEYMKVAEVYNFFVIDQHTIDTGAASPAGKPRMEFSNVINTGKDNGYDASQAKPMENKDPHSGKSIGYFTINGYTRQTTEKDGTPVFLKTVGDEVTLWFTLTQDINCLFGNENLKIAEDTKSYDKALAPDPTNFKHGALIVKYTDEENHSSEPVIYFDFLAANTMTGADTRIQLYEEGEYEVVLDYEIVDTKGIDSYSDYKISFKFAIRNGNTMAFPRDSRTGSELKDGAITPNGFVVDLAESKYLTIDIVRREVNEGADGTLSTSVRNNAVGKDGSTYTKEGIYEITVKNRYSDGKPTTVTIYVGTNKNILALAKNHLTIDQLNDLIRNGTTIDDDGSLIAPPKETEPAPTEPEPTETVPPETEAVAPVETVEATQPTVVESAPVETVSATEESVGEESTPETEEESPKSNVPVMPIVVGGVVAAAGVVFGLKKKRPGKEEN